MTALLALLLLQQAAVDQSTGQVRCAVPFFKIQQTFEIRAWPTYIVIDDEGIIRLRTSGTTARESARLSDEIRKLMKAAKSRIH